MLPRTLDPGPQNVTAAQADGNQPTPRPFLSYNPFIGTRGPVPGSVRQDLVSCGYVRFRR